MHAQVEEQFLSVHDNLLKSVDSLKFDIKMFLRDSTNSLSEIDNFSGYKDEEYKIIFDEYRAYMTGLFDMLAKTTDYISEMMVKTQIARKLFSINNCSSSFNSNGESDSLLSLSCPNETISTSDNINRQRTIQNLFDKDTETIDQNDKNTLNRKYPLQNVMMKRPKIPCGTLDTSIFEIGSIIPRASVCSVDSNGSNFCICLVDCPEFELLVKSYTKIDRRVYTQFPEPGVLFGMKVEDGTIRALRCLPPSDWNVYLPDFGDIVEIDRDLNNIFYLTEEEQNIPGQAILCCLHNATNSEIEPTGQHEFLISMLYKETSFKVYNCQDGVLTVSITPYDVSENNKDEINKSNNEVTNQMPKSNNEERNQLTTEDWELLYEDPSSTSNALKAVLGYEPKDDQRICRFYNEKTGTCFKGNNCRQLHTPLLPDYFTKDQKAANAFAANHTTYEVIFEENTMLEVFITHIRNIEYFYGMVYNSQENQPEPLIWTDADIPKSDYLNRPPLPYDIILAKFKQDGNWYRAQVVDVDESGKTIHVFYLDYGNRQYVSLKHIAKCAEAIARLPRQVQPFRIANLHTIQPEIEILERGMSMLIDMLVNKSVKLCVVSQFEDVFVRFVEEPYCDIPKLLCDMHCATTVEMF